MIEQLDDIIEGLANKLGVYGAHHDGCKFDKPCRVCWTSNLRERIINAVEIERKLSV